MRLYCSNTNCDFEFEDNPTNAALSHCPKCYGRTFSNPKQIMPMSTMAFANQYFSQGTTFLFPAEGQIIRTSCTSY